jgi:ubiquitin-conjugating enzyme E2 variant
MEPKAPRPSDNDTLSDTQTSSASATFSQRKQNAALLASQYTSTKRAGEYVSVVAYFGLFALISSNLLGQMSTPYFWLIILSSCILSMLLADLFSGLAHWGADTWGNLETPLFGKTFIRSFREHHVDPFRITCHDFIEANGDNCMVAAIPLAILSFVKMSNNPSEVFTVSFLTFLCFWVAFTNQIHKWSHMLKPPMFVQVLQDYRIILSRKDHQIHHHTPFDRYYCITTGWLNPVLGAIGFWKRLENVITNLTGAIPRQDDAYWTVQFKSSDLPPAQH